MCAYALRRTLWMVPTLFGVTFLCFVMINLAPGGPFERDLAGIRFVGHGPGEGVSREVVARLRAQYGMDRPLLARYGIWLKNSFSLDFGASSAFRRPALAVIAERIPVSLQFGLASFILIYFVSVPLGVAKAVGDGGRPDAWSSLALMVPYAVPPLVLGVLLRVYLAGGQHLNLFPLGELYSDNYFALGVWGRALDRAHHFVLPLLTYVAGGFTMLTFLTKNSVLGEIRADYVRTARAKGLGEWAVVLRHALRNALIPLVTGLGDSLSVFFAGSIVVEQIFAIDGMGGLALAAVGARDYNVLMALIFIQSGLAMAGRLVSDLAYMAVDPRIDLR